MRAALDRELALHQLLGCTASRVRPHARVCPELPEPREVAARGVGREAAEKVPRERQPPRMLDPELVKVKALHPVDGAQAVGVVLRDEILQGIQAVRAQGVVGVAWLLDVGRGAGHSQHVPELRGGIAQPRPLVAVGHAVVDARPSLLDGDPHHRGAHALGRGPRGANAALRARAHVALVHDLAVLHHDVAHARAHARLGGGIGGLQLRRRQALALRRGHLPRSAAGPEPVLRRRTVHRGGESHGAQPQHIETRNATAGEKRCVLACSELGRALMLIDPGVRMGVSWFGKCNLFRGNIPKITKH